jgi:DNA-binding transcriptional ArsR family regulator
MLAMGAGSREGDLRREASILRALASEPRLRIVRRLAEGECCVCDLVTLIGADQSTVSKHLALLRNNGIVEGDRRGQHVYYRLLTPCVLSFLSCARQVMDERAGSREPRG